MPPYVDDLERCPDDARLLRILRDSNFWHPRDAPTRASSGAFYDSSRENSCFMLHILVAEHFDKIRQTYPESRLAVVTARAARQCGYTVSEDPDDFLPGHVVVCPPREIRKNEYRRMASRLAEFSILHPYHGQPQAGI